MELVKVYLEDAEMGLDKLEEVILHNIENENKAVMISGTFTKVHGLNDALEKYHQGSSFNGQHYDGAIFHK